MTTEDAADLLAHIIRQWLRDARTCAQDRRELARFLDLPEERIASLAMRQGRRYPAGRPDARTATSRHTFAARTPRTR